MGRHREVRGVHGVMQRKRSCGPVDLLAGPVDCELDVAARREPDDLRLQRA